jgi:hypothetical protein
MWHRVAFVRTYVSEEIIASLISVTRIIELGTLAVTTNWSTLRSSETSVLIRTILSHTKDGFLHSHLRVKPQILLHNMSWFHIMSIISKLACCSVFLRTTSSRQIACLLNLSSWEIVVIRNMCSVPLLCFSVASLLRDLLQLMACVGKRRHTARLPVMVPLKWG